MNRLTQHGYTLVNRSPGLTIIVREELAGLLASNGLDLFPQPSDSSPAALGPAAGRAPVIRQKIDSGPPLIIKTYRRGGLAGRLLGDRYTSSNRAFEEVRVCAAAAKAGLNVQLIGIYWILQSSRYRFQFAAATREIPEPESSFAALRRLAGEASQRQMMLEKIARQVRGLHEAGIDHPDLNLGNILVSRQEGKNDVHLIDFDRATLQDRPLGLRQRQSALIRIYRSLVKLSLPDGPSLSPEEKELFLSAYWQDGGNQDRSLRRRCRRELAFHRLWWRLSGTGSK